MSVGVFFELLENSIALFRRNTAVVLKRVCLGNSGGDFLERFNPLAENDCFLTTSNDFGKIGLEPLKFATAAGGRIEVADLLQAQNQFNRTLELQQVLFLLARKKMRSNIIQEPQEQQPFLLLIRVSQMCLAGI